MKETADLQKDDRGCDTLQRGIDFLDIYYL